MRAGGSPLADRSLVLFVHVYTHTHTHVKPATTRSSREVYRYFCCGVDCEETDRLFFPSRFKLHAYGVFFSARETFFLSPFLVQLRAFGFVCLFLLMSTLLFFLSLFLFCTFLLMRELSWFWGQSFIAHVAVQCFHLVLFSP